MVIPSQLPISWNKSKEEQIIVIPKVQVKIKHKKRKAKNSDYGFDDALEHMQTIYIYNGISHIQKNGNIPLLISDLVAFFETPSTE